jgi:hypothetical protein
MHATNLLTVLETANDNLDLSHPIRVFVFVRRVRQGLNRVHAMRLALGQSDFEEACGGAVACTEIVTRYNALRTATLGYITDLEVVEPGMTTSVELPAIL